MSSFSNNDIAEAIYNGSLGKSGIDLNDFLRKAVLFLKRKHLLGKTNDILKKLDDLIDKKEKRLSVKVRSVRQLDENIKKELVSLLKKHYQTETVLLKEKIDESLLGGIRLEIKDEVIDLSIKNKIKKLQENLIK